VILDPDDFWVEERQVDPIAFAEDKETWVYFDTELNDDLKREGFMSDLLRHL
jgi:hypothetical protein